MFGFCVKRILEGTRIFSSLGGGLQVWSKEQGLGPCRAGVRGFKSHPPHLYKENILGSRMAMLLWLSGLFSCKIFLFLNILEPSNSVTYSNPASMRLQISFSVLATFEMYSFSPWNSASSSWTYSSVFLMFLWPKRCIT